jgi:hypothetical protein
MVVEDILLVVVVGVVLLLVGWPLVRLLKTAARGRRDPLAEARERLKAAQQEAEAARLNREADRIYDRLYSEALDDGDGRRARVEEPQAVKEPQQQREEEREQGRGPAANRGKQHGED